MFALALALADCNRNTSQSQSQNEAPATAVASAPPPAPAPPPPIPPGTELPLNSINRVMLSRPADAPGALVVHVSGTAATAGWTEPKLTLVPEAGPDPSVMSYEFVATSPQAPDERRVAQPVETELRIEALAPEVKTIRVVSATNEVSAPVAQ